MMDGIFDILANVAPENQKSIAIVIGIVLFASIISKLTFDIIKENNYKKRLKEEILKNSEVSKEHQRELIDLEIKHQKEKIEIEEKGQQVIESMKGQIVAVCKKMDLVNDKVDLVSQELKTVDQKVDKVQEDQEKFQRETREQLFNVDDGLVSMIIRNQKDIELMNDRCDLINKK
jgi:hypothetical protein